MDARAVGIRLKKLRGKKTRRTVSDETGISYSGLGNYECGLRIPTDEHKVALAKYYGVSVQELFYEEENH